MTRTFLIEPTGYPEIPRMMLATLNALRAIGGSANLQELDEQVVEIEGITEDEQAYMLPNGKFRKLNYYLAWARTFLKRGGALENSSRGVWALTEVGDGIHNLEAVKEIYDQVNAEERARAKAKREAKKQEDTSVIEDEDLEEAHENDWRINLLDTVRSIEPDAFERLSQRLLREAGFIKVEVRGKTGDGGIDGLGILRVNLVSFQVYFQCKKWKGSVGSKEIRDFRGAIQGRADKGLFITTGNFTSQASEEATRDGAIAIDLIDGERLCDLLKQFELGVSTEMIEKIVIDPVWFNAL